LDSLKISPPTNQVPIGLVISSLGSDIDIEIIESFRSNQLEKLKESLVALIPVLITIALVGFIVWLILQIPMPPPFHKVIIAIVCVVLVLYVLQLFGFTAGLPAIRLK